jgi:uncharacterized protein YdhG (YjbR/CyaY superfamily)
MQTAKEKSMLARKARTKVASSVDEYLAQLPEDSRAALEKLRRTIKSIVPDAVEVISCQIPTFKYQGRMLASYAAFQEHCSFFPGSTPIEVHANELKAFQTSKGTIRFTTEEPLPASLIRKLVKTCMKRNTAYAKKK